MIRKLLKSIIVSNVVLFGLLLIIFSHQIAGWHAYVVSSASMEPTIKIGSVILTHYVHPSTLHEKDIITFIEPSKERRIVTHRIKKMTQKDKITIFKTKGDKNKNEDTWTLAGGGVVGKVVYIIPYLGHFISFVQSKIGVILFILLPATYIIIDEIFNVINTIKHHRKKNKIVQGVVALLLVSFTGIIIYSTPPSYALLSDSAILANNSFTINITSPTPTQTPTPIPTEFPSCSSPEGKIISSYKTGLHEIIGVGLLKGSDVVYQLTDSSKDKVLQCFCPEAGIGIQTNWLKTQELDKYKNNGWPYSVNSGLSWNLDDSPYVARNTEYPCK